MIRIIFVVLVLVIQLTGGQIAQTTKCTSSSTTDCVYSQIRCPDNYYFNGQYCLPVQAPANKSAQYLSPTLLPPTKCLPGPPKTVEPKKPDPLPVKPVCEHLYDWNGHQCYKTLSSDPVCPQGHDLTIDGQCVSVMEALCQQGYYQHLGFCVGLLEVPVRCPNNFYWDGTKCVNTVVPTCPEGFVLNNGNCEMVDTGSCPSGTVMDNFKCIGHHQVNIECTHGHSWDGRNCVSRTNSCEDGYTLQENVCKKNIVQSPVYECPPRTKMSGDQCISEELICPKDYSLIDSRCVEQIVVEDSVVTPNCTVGFRLVGCECVKINDATTVPPTPTCPPNFVYRDGSCHYVGPTNPTTNCTNIDCSKNYTICNCPGGYVLTDGFCILTGHETKICPSGYQLVNGICVAIDQPNRCSPGFHWDNGRCVQSECPSGTQLENGYCKIVIDKGSDDCIVPCTQGHHCVNGKCVDSTTVKPNPPTDNPPTGNPPSGSPPTGSPPTGNPPAENPPTGNPPTGNPPTENPPTGNPPTGNPPTGNPPTGNPPTGNPPTGNPPTTNPPTTPTLPPIIEPCDPNNLNPICKPVCPSANITCQPCPTSNNPCQPCPTCNTPCQPCPTDNNSTPTCNIPCQPCPTCNNPCPSCPRCDTNCQPCQTNTPPSSNTGCANCPQTSHYITKDGHISITNIVNIAHHHPAPLATHHNDIDETFDYDTTSPSTTEESDGTKNCCEITTPRQCKRTGDEWTCYHKKYQRCGDVCTRPKIYLRPKVIHYQAPILIMPPPPRRILGRRRMFGGEAVDCSGCIHGGYRCSTECYSYPECRRPDCAYIDQATYCEEWDHIETEGCSIEDGYYA